MFPEVMDGESITLDVTCSDGSVILGGGGTARQVAGIDTRWVVALTETRPVVGQQGQGWQVSAVVRALGDVISGDAVSIRVDAYAVCSIPPQDRS